MNERRKKIICPNCKREMEHKFKTVISLENEDDMQDILAIITRRLFIKKCPHCHESFLYRYPLCYIDVSHSAVIFFAFKEHHYNFALKQINENEEVKKFKNIRIVFTPEQLREKMLIFNLGLDDRYIEILKHMNISSYMKMHPLEKIDRIHFSAKVDKDEKYFIYYLKRGKRGGIAFNKSQYDKIENRFKQRVNYHENDFIIDYNWVLDMCLKKGKKTL